MLPVSEQLDACLPRLRAYLRAALGNETRADDYLAEAIEQLSLLYDSDMLSTDENVEFRMLRLIEGVIQNRAGNNFHRSAWRAILLVHLEGLSAIETARILGLDFQFVERLTDMRD